MEEEDQLGRERLKSEHPLSYDSVQDLPIAIYATDAEGCVLFFNSAAVKLWGRRPVRGQEWWCGSWRLFQPDGTPQRHDQCPMAVALKQNRRIYGAEAMAGRAGQNPRALPGIPPPLQDEFGKLAGG